MKRNILEVAPQLADHFIDIEDAIASKTNSQINESRVGKYYQYLGLLHDSWVLKANLTPQKFLLTLNDFTTHVFADALIAKKGLKFEDDKLVFKIDVDFEIDSITYNIVDEDGIIEEIKPIGIDEYLYEDIITVTDELIKIGLVVWSKGRGKKPGRHILILIDAKSVSLEEHQNDDWKDVFGDTYDHYYNCFKAELLKGTYLSDQSLCGKLIDEIDTSAG